MLSFTVDLFLDGRQYKVQFDQYFGSNGPKYFVYVRSRNGDSYYFNMEKTINNWRIINAPIVKELFLKNENKFSEANVAYNNCKK